MKNLKAIFVTVFVCFAGFAKSPNILQQKSLSEREFDLANVVPVSLMLGICRKAPTF